MKIRKGYYWLSVFLIAFFLCLTGFQNSKVQAEELPIKLQLDTIVEGRSISGDFEIQGFALSQSGVQKVELFIDSLAKEQVTYGLSRPDVSFLYASYTQSANSGFSYDLNTRKYSNGEHTLNLLVTTNDGKTQSGQWKVFVYNKQTPIIGQAVASKAQAIQYFLNNNIKDYNYINSFVNIVWEEASIENIRADVVFAQMMKETNFLKFTGDVKEEQNNFAGLGATGGVPGNSFPDIRTGIRAVIQHLKAYASKEALKQNVVDPRYNYVIKGSAPYVEWLGKNENPNGIGWATSINYGYDIVNRVNDIRAVTITQPGAVINSFIANSTAETGKSFLVSGSGTSSNTVLYRFLIKDYSTGAWTVIQDYSESGTFTWVPAKAGQFSLEMHVKDKYSLKEFDAVTTKDVTVVQQQVAPKTIVIDAGHGGTDPGASSTISGVNEEKLNLQVSLKLQNELQNLGYNVIMTRTTESQTLSLSDRVNIANNAKADLFISIHHNSVEGNTTANGIETHYSTYKPGIDNSGVIIGNDPNGAYTGVYIDTTPSPAAIESRDLANSLVNGLSSLGYTNRLSHDHNLAVTKSTNMPAVLIELGFLSNPTEAQRCADDAEESKKAKKIAQIINSFFNNS